tara:strand:- start:34 stop:450 length:417 start_codon:yes stop_codon:yes gene_type:complete
MKKKEKKDIIDILTKWRDMIGVDSRHVNNLIDQVDRIYIPEEIDISEVEVIFAEMSNMCSQLEYDVKLNTIRGVKNTTRRMAIYKAAEIKHGRTASLDYVAKEFFNKDRTTLLYWRKKADDFIETKDPMFVRYVNELL